MKSVFRDYRALTALVAVFLILGGIYAVVTPLFEAGDEIWHYPFVQFLATGHGLPIQDPGRKDLWEQEGGQPPLYYALSAAVTFWIDTRDLPDRLWRNPYAKIGIPLAFGNKNLIVHTSAEDFPWRDTTLAVHLIRFLSLLLSAATVVLTYLLAKEIYPSLPRAAKGRSQRLPPIKRVESDALVLLASKRSSEEIHSGPKQAGSEVAASSTTKTVVEEPVSRLEKGGWRGLAFLSAALVAFNPMFLFISASVNNDSLAVVLASLALLLIVQLTTRGMDKRRSFVLGIVCGLGALTKVSDLGLLPLALLVVAWMAYRRLPNEAKSSRYTSVTTRFLIPALWITIPSFLIAGWWYARNYVYYGDPLGFNVWLKIAGGRITPATLFGLLDEFQGFRISFWGNFGGVNLIAPEWVYTVLDVISIVAVVGLAAAVLRRRVPAPLLIPALWLGIVFAGLLRWTLLTYASQGRLIFPAISAVGVLFSFGLGSLSPDRWRVPNWKWWRASSLQPLGLASCVFLFALAIAAPFRIISPAYSLPARLPGDTPAPNPVHITYAAVASQPELVGYDIERSVRGGEELPLTLFWRSTTAVDEDLYIYIHLYDASGKGVGEWEALPGNGLYPTRLWQPGELILDRYRIPVSTQVVGPQVGRVEVGLTRVGSTIPLPARNPSGETIVPTIAHFKIAPPPTAVALRPALFKFADEFEVVTLHFSGARGGRAFEIGADHSQNTPLFGGDILRVALTLRALRTPSDDYTAFVHVVNSGGQIVVQMDEPPGGSAYPTSFWDPGEEDDSQYDLKIPDDLPSGDYQVEIGLYHSNDGPRLPVSGNAIGALTALTDHLILTHLAIGK